MFNLLRVKKNNENVVVIRKEYAGNGPEYTVMQCYEGIQPSLICPQTRVSKEWILEHIDTIANCRASNGRIYSVDIKPEFRAKIPELDKLGYKGLNAFTPSPEELRWYLKAVEYFYNCLGDRAVITDTGIFHYVMYDAKGKDNLSYTCCLPDPFNVISFSKFLEMSCLHGSSLDTYLYINNELYTEDLRNVLSGSEFTLKGVNELHQLIVMRDEQRSLLKEGLEKWYSSPYLQYSKLWNEYSKYLDDEVNCGNAWAKKSKGQPAKVFCKGL